MKIILKRNYAKLGKMHELVEVKPGYARNYLIPNDVAIEATPAMQKTYIELKKQGLRKKKILKHEAEELAARLDNVKLEIREKTGSRGKIFGSVSASKISQALKEQGINILPENIVFKENIKELGDYIVKLHLFEEVECDLTVSVLTA